MLGESNQPHGNAHLHALPHGAKSYTLKPVVKPLPSQQAGSSASQPANASGDLQRSSASEKMPAQKVSAGKRLARPANEPRFRDITEDDDGYHPYADVPDTRPLFEENPWD